MDIVGGAVRAVTETANATAAAAGAVGGAAVNGVIGGVQGTVAGIRNGVNNGSHSTPAALLTLGAIGATGLVEWPLVLTIGGTALLIRQLNQRSDGRPARAPSQASSGSQSRTAAGKSPGKPAKSTAARRHSTARRA